MFKDDVLRALSVVITAYISAVLQCLGISLFAIMEVVLKLPPLIQLNQLSKQ